MPDVQANFDDKIRMHNGLDEVDTQLVSVTTAMAAGRGDQADQSWGFRVGPT